MATTTHPTRTRYHVTMMMGALDWAKHPELRDAMYRRMGAHEGTVPSLMENYQFDSETDARTKAAELQARYPEADIRLERAEQEWRPADALGNPEYWFSTRAVALAL
jgi:hypothetical protein